MPPLPPVTGLAPDAPARPTRPATRAEPPPLRPGARVVWILVTLVAAISLASQLPLRPHGEPRQITGSVVPPSPAPSETVATFRANWVSPAGFTPSAHASVNSVLPDGRVMTVWFGGTREGAADVAIFTAIFDAANGTWSAPTKIMDRAQAQQELGRPIRKLGNAVIFPDRDGTLWLVYVTVTLGGWSGSALNVATSRDLGRTWSTSRRLTVNPFFNLSSLVRNKPVYADDGRIGLPVYHEMATTYAQMLWLTPSPGGGVNEFSVRSLLESKNTIQPAVVPSAGGAVMTLRDHGPQRRLHVAQSGDQGWNWSKPAPGELPNPDAAADLIRLRDGRLLLAYNHASAGRANLRLATSRDDGRTWTSGPSLEEEAGQEFSYPSLSEDPQGRVHVTYTWKRERIKHVEFNAAWLEEKSGAAPVRP
jgi:predicted neuraminidase